MLDLESRLAALIDGEMRGHEGDKSVNVFRNDAMSADPQPIADLGARLEIPHARIGWQSAHALGLVNPVSSLCEPERRVWI